jgi:hypothetical protein
MYLCIYLSIYCFSVTPWKQNEEERKWYRNTTQGAQGKLEVVIGDRQEKCLGKGLNTGENASPGMIVSPHLVHSAHLLFSAESQELSFKCPIWQKTGAPMFYVSIKSLLCVSSAHKSTGTQLCKPLYLDYRGNTFIPIWNVDAINCFSLALNFCGSAGMT